MRSNCRAKAARARITSLVRNCRRRRTVTLFTPRLVSKNWFTLTPAVVTSASLNPALRKKSVMARVSRSIAAWTGPSSLPVSV